METTTTASTASTIPICEPAVLLRPGQVRRLTTMTICINAWMKRIPCPETTRSQYLLSLLAVILDRSRVRDGSPCLSAAQLPLRFVLG